MKFTLPTQLASISPYFAVLQAPTAAEQAAGITDKVRVLRSGPTSGEITIAMKKVPSQRASLQVRTLNGKPVNGMTRILGGKEPDLLARAGLILQVLANANHRTHTIPLERYCDPAQLEKQRGLMEEETRALIGLGMSAEGPALFRKLSVVTERPGAGVLLRKEPPDFEASNPSEILIGDKRDQAFWLEFRKNLRTFVEASPLTQTAMDQQAGLYDGHISHLKCGTSNKLPTQDQIVGLAKILDVLPSDLHSSFAGLDELAIVPQPAPDVPGAEERVLAGPEPEATPAEVKVILTEDALVGQAEVVPVAPVQVLPEPAPQPAVLAPAPVPPVSRDEKAPSSVMMVSAPRTSRVRITVDADVDYRIGRQIMDLIHLSEAAADMAHPV